MIHARKHVEHFGEKQSSTDSRTVGWCVFRFALPGFSPVPALPGLYGSCAVNQKYHDRISSSKTFSLLTHGQYLHFFNVRTGKYCFFF